MKRSIAAVYEHGVFRPLRKPGIPDGQRVRLTVDAPEPKTNDVLALAARVYAGLTEDEIREIERIALDRPAFFGRRGN